MRSPKALLDWDGEPLIAYQARTLHEAGVNHVIVVLGAAAEAVRPLVEGETVVVNEHWSKGRASSLRVGAGAVPDGASAVVVANVDQPRPAGVIRRLLEEQAAGALITQPAHGGRRGHPIVLDGRLIPELREVHDETQGLRAVIQRHAEEVWVVPFDDEAVLLDINTPEDYERAVAYLGQVKR
jgi:CTP:molybdopterin cytidylyltransferase MocA